MKRDPRVRAARVSRCAMDVPLCTHTSVPHNTRSPAAAVAVRCVWDSLPRQKSGGKVIQVTSELVTRVSGLAAGGT